MNEKKPKTLEELFAREFLEIKEERDELKEDLQTIRWNYIKALQAINALHVEKPPNGFISVTGFLGPKDGVEAFNFFKEEAERRENGRKQEEKKEETKDE